MKVRVGFTVVLCALTAVGCVSSSGSAKFTSNVDVSTVRPDPALASKVEQVSLDYTHCIANAMTTISKARFAKGHFPSMRARIYEDKCAAEERRLYVALYSAAFAGKQVPEDFRHATAKKGVRLVKQATFAAIGKHFVPSA